jgi:diketogulonate reductase-like aldo/keto reductase
MLPPFARVHVSCILFELSTEEGLHRRCRPGFGLNGFANDAYVEGLAQCKQQGLCEAVGVSNFNAERLAKAADKLEMRGMVLASNQVE